MWLLVGFIAAVCAELTEDGSSYHGIHLEARINGSDEMEPWQNWSKIVPSGNKLVRLRVPSPSGIMLTEHVINNQLVRVGRLRHSVLSIREEWAPVITTNKPLIPVHICASIIEHTEEYARRNGWTMNRHEHYPTTDIPLRSVFPYGDVSLEARAVDSAIAAIYAVMADRFKLRRELLQVEDLFLAKYDATQPGKQVDLAPHQDKNMFSFVLALNEEYTDGGTYFFSTQQLAKVGSGGAVMFHGMHWHAGYPISSGIRYIIAGFCNYGDEDSFDQFLEYYDPQMDGYAAGAGFLPLDIVRGMDKCMPADPRTSEETGTTQQAVRREVVSVDGLTHEGWASVATSCESLDPHTPLTMIVERRE